MRLRARYNVTLRLYLILSCYHKLSDRFILLDFLGFRLYNSRITKAPALDWVEFNRSATRA